jgi:hypothetical protein
MKKLTIEDFKKVAVGVGFPSFLQHYTKDMRQVCLEPCLEGFCIGIYDDEDELIGEKRCTKITPNPELLGAFRFGEEVSAEALNVAIAIANEMLAVCDECGGRGEHIHDSYDHRGEHVQDVDKCERCNGTGKVQ